MFFWKNILYIISVNKWKELALGGDFCRHNYFMLFCQLADKHFAVALAIRKSSVKKIHSHVCCPHQGFPRFFITRIPLAAANFPAPETNFRNFQSGFSENAISHKSFLFSIFIKL